MVRYLTIFLTGWLAAVSSISTARAETRNPFRDPPSWLHLIQDPDTQKQLVLTDEQVEEIQRIIGAAAEEADAGQKQIEKLLSEPQKRLMQKLDLQQEGGYALLNERIAAYLVITDEQKGKLKEIVAANEIQHTEMRNTMMVARFASAEAMAKFIADYRETADAALLEILTEDQSKKLKALFADVEKLK